MKKIIGVFLSTLYARLVRISQASYFRFPFRIRKVSARVISVGNITWGGTGKTPLVAKLAHELAERGKKVAILTRGYGMDEVQELEKKLSVVPVVVGRDRVARAKEAIKKHKAEILLLDDGFQHLRLARDLDIVTINATIPFGPGGLIPMGTLREPIENLRRAQVFILTKSDLGAKNVHWIRQKIQSIKPDAVIFEAVHHPVQFLDFKRNRYVPLQDIKGKEVAVISGIGDPYAFEKTVEGLGTKIHLAARFDDHHAYRDSEIIEFVKRCKEVGVKDVITTQKDFFRIEPLLKRRRSHDFQNLNFLVLQIEIRIDDEEDLIRRCLNP